VQLLLWCLSPRWSSGSVLLRQVDRFVHLLWAMRQVPYMVSIPCLGLTDGFYRHRFTNVAYTGDAWRIPVYSINETLHLACICLTTSLLHPSFPSFGSSSLIQPHSPCLILAPCLLNALSSRASLRTKHSPSFGGRFALVSAKSLLRSRLSVCPISVATTRRDPSSGLSQMANSISVAGTK